MNCTEPCQGLYANIQKTQIKKDIKDIEVLKLTLDEYNRFKSGKDYQKEVAGKT